MNKEKARELFKKYKHIDTTAARFGQVNTIPLVITWEELGSKVQELKIPMNIRWKTAKIFYSQVIYTGMCVVDDSALAVYPPDRDSAWAAEKLWESLRQVLEQALELRMRSIGSEAGSYHRNGWYDIPPDRWLIGDGKLEVPGEGPYQLECLSLVYWTDSYPRYVTNYMTYKAPLDREAIMKQERWRYF